MRKRLFDRSLALATASAATLILAACGGGSDNTGAGASVVQPGTQTSSAAADEPDAENPSAEGRVLSADAGAATREPL